MECTDTCMDDARYIIKEEEVVEDNSLIIPGETIVADDTEGFGADDVPIRTLSDFSVYEWYSQQLIDIAYLMTVNAEFQTSYMYGASGLVRPYIDDDDEVIEEDEDTQINQLLRVKLSRILDFNVHFITYTAGRPQMDPKIYIRTLHAWYILDKPSDAYFPFFCVFWINHRMLHLVTTASLNNPRIDYERFIASLRVTDRSTEATAIVLRMLRRELTQEDLESSDVQDYVCGILDTLCSENVQLQKALSRVPLISTLRERFKSFPNRAACNSKKSVVKGPRRSTNVGNDVFRRSIPTVVTPVVDRIARGFFVTTLRVAGRSPEDAASASDDLVPVKSVKVHDEDPVRIEWVGSSRIVPKHYNSVIVDGVTYTVGDTVIVEKGPDYDNTRQNNAASEPSRSTNELANNKWFCTICYLYEEEEEVVHVRHGRITVKKKYFHCQWLQHASQTILQESAHANCLFRLNECDDLPLECIYSHCNLRVLDHDEPEPNGETDDQFYTWLTWEPHNAAFVEMPRKLCTQAIAQCKRWKRCLSCGLRSLRKRQTTFQQLDDGAFSCRGVDYHLHDFVYLTQPQSSENSMLLGIAQIEDIIFNKQGQVKDIEVRRYGRYDLAVLQSIRNRKTECLRVKDSRRLFRTSIEEVIDPSQIDGKLFVKYLATTSEQDAWVEHDDHFYVDRYAKTLRVDSFDDLHPLKITAPECIQCNHRRKDALGEAKRILQRHGPLRGLELFAGAGGLSTGLEAAGVVKTKWAVERCPSAAKTFSKNHPEATVYNQDTNLLLKHAIEQMEGNKPTPLMSVETGSRQKLPPMPMPGEVEFIYGGPPCQGFSLMNHQRMERRDDVRNTLVCNMLSYVEFYRPAYFLLENVFGLLAYPIARSQDGVDVAITMGVVKVILRTLTCLGYQVQFRLLQAGQYGVPQARKRVIFWGAKREYPMPAFPVPTHCFESISIRLPTGDFLHPPTRANVNSRSKKSDYRKDAPHLPVTVNDAISDLPRFDWVNPFERMRRSQKDLDAITDRRDRGIDQIDARTSNIDTVAPGFHQNASYACPPRTRYQVWIRRNAGAEVQHHYTRRFAANVVERVVRVPLRRDANHSDLPRELRIARAFRGNDVDGEPNPDYRTLYGRIDGDKLFRTAMTAVVPYSKGGQVLHPNQKRILTVREYARAQGFPDKYEFLSASKHPSRQIEDQYRQIGNAVPIPLALALGKELKKVLVDFWGEQYRNSERTLSPEL